MHRLQNNFCIRCIAPLIGEIVRGQFPWEGLFQERERMLEGREQSGKCGRDLRRGQDGVECEEYGLRVHGVCTGVSGWMRRGLTGWRCESCGGGSGNWGQERGGEGVREWEGAPQDPGVGTGGGGCGGKRSEPGGSRGREEGRGERPVFSVSEGNAG